MPLILLIIFIVVPIAEIAILIKLGGTIGLAATIALVILTAVVGTSLLRWQGISVLNQAMRALNEGRLPVDKVFDGVFLVISGAFLLTPGLLTDAVGFALLVPAFRKVIAAYIFKRLKASKNIHVDIFGQGMGSGGMGGGSKPGDGGGQGEGPIIEGEIVEEHEPEETDTGRRGKPNEKSPWRKGEGKTDR